MRLIWHTEALTEAEWIRFLLEGLIEGETSDPQMQVYDSGIHVISGNKLPLWASEAYFREIRRLGHQVYLFHVSDEWFSGGYEIYRYFDGVIRNYATHLAESPGICTVPLGYPNGTRLRSCTKPADRRNYIWSFVGEVKSSRTRMVAELEQLSPRYILGSGVRGDLTNPARPLDQNEYQDILEESIFVPCPMGNSTLESWRLYEALELGCIPLVEKRCTIDYFRKLFGQHPIPSFRTWRDARRFMQSDSGRGRLVVIQNEVRNWWRTYKYKVRDDVHRLVNGPSQSAELGCFSMHLRNRFRAAYEPSRLFELARHQTAYSLLQRLKWPRAPVRRILVESRRNLE